MRTKIICICAATIKSNLDNTNNFAAIIRELL